MRDQGSAGPGDQPEPAVPVHDGKYFMMTGAPREQVVKVGEPSTESAIT
jgi:hypothetical protein